MNGFAQKIYNFFINIYDNILVAHRKRVTKKKYKDKKRVAIYSKITLSKEQKREIDKLYKANYGKKIPYIWHRHFTAFTGNFDAGYFPEILFIPCFEHYMNLNTAYNNSFCDKNVTPLLAKAVGIKTPKTFVANIEGFFIGSEGEPLNRQEVIATLTNIGNCFIKPTVDSNSGKNCLLVSLKNGIDEKSGKTIEEILNKYQKNFVIQEQLVCHPSITKIYGSSVNTFRVITYLWNGSIKHVPATMRIGRGGNFLDNAHAGGIFIAVDDDGTMHKTAFTEFGERFDCHPDTQFKFEGYTIELFPNVIKTAKKMHASVAQIGIINWDFTIDGSGEPVLIEMNIERGGIWLPQMAHGVAPFGKDTAEILRWIKLMEKTKATERYKYAYGKMNKT